MKKFFCRSLVVSLLLLPCAGWASWFDNDPFSTAKPKASEPTLTDFQSKDGLSAQFWFIHDDRSTHRWFQLDFRKIDPVSATRKDNPVVVALFFVNAGEQEAFVRAGQRVSKVKVNNLTYDLKVIRPDGVVDNHPNLPAWQGEAPSPYLVRIARAKAVITFDIEPAGKYRVLVTVHDRVRKTDIELERTLLVNE